MICCFNHFLVPSIEGTVTVVGTYQGYQFKKLHRIIYYILSRELFSTTKDTSSLTVIYCTSEGAQKVMSEWIQI